MVNSRAESKTVFTYQFRRIFVVATAYRDSEKTSAHKFTTKFSESMNEVREMIDRVKTAKL